MCGIAGEVIFDDLPLDSTRTRLMCQHMRYRGPDELCILETARAVLGISRLKVIGLNDHEQPVHNEDKSIIAVFNGEIYNHLRLRDELRKLGWTPKGQSDAEVIVPLYERFGLDFVSHLHGMFAIALYDGRQHTLHLVTDAVGKKPLFYSRLPGGRLVFGSELAPIKKSVKEGDIDIDLEALDRYLSYRIIPAPHTIYKDTRRVPPASIVSFERNRQPVTKQYWRIKFAKREHDQRALTEELIQRIEQSVADRLEADVPIGATLSGGLDSSLVVAIASKMLSRPVKAFSVGFAQSDFDETGYAELIARHCNAEHRVHYITVDDARAAIDRILDHMGEPYAFPSAIASYYMFKLAREEVTVALTGDGSDEIFGGYSRYRAMEEADRAVRAGSPSANGMGIGPGSFEFANAYHSILASGLSDGLKVSLYSDALRRLLPAPFPYNYIRECEEEEAVDTTTLLDRMMTVDFGFWLPDAQLVKIDRMAMANSVEPRSPMLDRGLVEFAAEISADLRIVGGVEKYVLKRAAEAYLPEVIFARRKQELAVPLEDWLSVNLGELIEKTLLSEASLNRGYFRPDSLRAFVLGRRRQDSYALWTLFMLERWHQLNTDGAAVELNQHSQRASFVEAGCLAKNIHFGRRSRS